MLAEYRSELLALEEWALLSGEIQRSSIAAKFAALVSNKFDSFTFHKIILEMIVRSQCKHYSFKEGVILSDITFKSLLEIYNLSKSDSRAYNYRRDNFSGIIQGHILMSNLSNIRDNLDFYNSLVVNTSDVSILLAASYLVDETSDLQLKKDMILVAAAIIDRNLESFQSRAGSPRILDVTKSPNVRLTEGGHIKIPNDPFIFHRLREALGEDSFNTILSDSNLNMVFKLNSTKAEFK